MHSPLSCPHIAMDASVLKNNRFNGNIDSLFPRHSIPCLLFIFYSISKYLKNIDRGCYSRLAKACRMITEQIGWVSSSVIPFLALYFALPFLWVKYRYLSERHVPRSVEPFSSHTADEDSRGARNRHHASCCLDAYNPSPRIIIASGHHHSTQIRLKRHQMLLFTPIPCWLASDNAPIHFSCSNNRELLTVITPENLCV